MNALLERAKGVSLPLDARVCTGMAHVDAENGMVFGSPFSKPTCCQAWQRGFMTISVHNRGGLFKQIKLCSNRYQWGRGGQTRDKNMAWNSKTIDKRLPSICSKWHGRVDQGPRSLGMVFESNQTYTPSSPPWPTTQPAVALASWFKTTEWASAATIPAYVA